jgi:hypothetical protein
MPPGEGFAPQPARSRAHSLPDLSVRGVKARRGYEFGAALERAGQHRQCCRGPGASGTLIGSADRAEDSPALIGSRGRRCELARFEGREFFSVFLYARLMAPYRMAPTGVRWRGAVIFTRRNPAQPGARGTKAARQSRARRGASDPRSYSLKLLRVSRITGGTAVPHGPYGRIALSPYNQNSPAEHERAGAVASPGTAFLREDPMLISLNWLRRARSARTGAALYRNRRRGRRHRAHRGRVCRPGGGEDRIGPRPGGRG